MDFSYFLCGLVVLLPLISAQNPPTATQKVEVKISATEEENVNIGDSRRYSCTMSPAPDYSTVMDHVKWTHDGEEIPTSGELTVEQSEEDGSVYLVINKFTDQHVGNYTCVGNDGAESDSKSFEMKAFRLMTMKSSLEQFGILGEDGEVECIVTAQPNAKISWKGPDNSRIRDSGDKYVITKKGLKISSLTKEHEGVYTCTAAQGALNFLKNYEIKYEVVQKPKIMGPLTIDPQGAMIGDEVKITCLAEGDPAPTYTFKRGSVAVEESKVSNGVYTIEKLTQQDEGNYTCLALNRGGQDVKSQKVDVLVPPTIELQETLNGVEEQMATVTCTAKGDPQPAIKWTKDGKDVDVALIQTGEATEIEGGSRWEVQSTLSLTLTHTHAGNWTCTASNSVGEPKSKDVKIVVQFKPVVEEDLAKSEFGWTGATRTLECRVSGNPLPTLKWFRPATDGDSGAKTEVLSDDTHTIGELEIGADFKVSQTLKVEVHESSDYGEYMCEATNIHGTEMHKIQLKEAKKPSLVTIGIKEALTSVLNLIVTPPTDDGEHGPKITEYIVKYKEGSSSAPFKTLDPQVRTGDENLVRLVDLLSDKTYEVTVIGKSDAGLGQVNTASFDTLSTSKPVKLALFPTGTEVIEQNSYNVKWGQPDDGGSTITKFTVKWQKIVSPENQKSAGGEEEKKELMGNVARNYEITNFEVGSTYLIKVTATNSIGESSEATKVITVPSDEAPVPSSESSSAGLGGGVIAIIIIVVLLVGIIVVVIFFVARRKPQLVERLRGRGNRADEEGGAKEGGKDPAEEEKLIKKDDAVKVENEVDHIPPQDDAPHEFEPENKPEPAVEESAEQPGSEEVAKPPETEIKAPGPETTAEPANPKA